MSARVVSAGRASDSSAADRSGDSGGSVEDVLKRLGNLETSVSDLKSQVSAVLATIPHWATKSDVADLRTDISNLEAQIIKWIIATLLTSTGLAFTIAKIVH
jgi:hypothetical protein